MAQGFTHAVHKTRMVLAAAVFCALAFATMGAVAETFTNADPDASSVIDEARALEISQAAIGRTVGDYTFRDTRGHKVRISDFRGKPLVISMNHVHLPAGSLRRKW